MYIVYESEINSHQNATLLKQITRR